MATGGLDGVLVSFKTTDIAFLLSLASFLFSILHPCLVHTSPFPSVSLVLLDLFFDLRGNDIVGTYMILVARSR